MRRTAESGPFPAPDLELKLPASEAEAGMLEGSLSMKDMLIRMVAFAAIVVPSCAYADLPPN